MLPPEAESLGSDPRAPGSLSLLRGFDFLPVKCILNSVWVQDVFLKMLISVIKMIATCSLNP
jgi:hypothetical protein